MIANLIFYLTKKRVSKPIERVYFTRPSLETLCEKQSINTENKHKALVEKCTKMSAKIGFRETLILRES